VGEQHSARGGPERILKLWTLRNAGSVVGTAASGDDRNQRRDRLLRPVPALR
jgi:hypothetical protein